MTAAAPHHTITNTAAKTKDAESPGAVALSIDDSSKHTNNGPHKSPGVNKIKIQMKTSKNENNNIMIMSEVCT